MLIHRQTGDAILTQDKRDRFNLRPDHVAAYQLRHRLPDDEVYVEDILPGGQLSVCESAVGRLCVLVCEDLDRLVQDGELLRSVGVSLVLVPIFSQEIIEGNWETSKASDLARQVGSTVVVANSLAIARAREAIGLVGPDWMTSFARVAMDPDVGYGHVVPGRANSRAEAVVFAIAGGADDAVPK